MTTRPISGEIRKPGLKNGSFKESHSEREFQHIVVTLNLAKPSNKIKTRSSYECGILFQSWDRAV